MPCFVRAVLLLLGCLIDRAQPLTLHTLARPARSASPAAAAVLSPAFGRRERLVVMQEDGGYEREGKRGRTATIAKPKPKPKEKSKEDVENEPMWRVLLHNDDVHTWDYVIFAIVSVVRTITRKKAHKITTQVHTMGTATVTVTWKQMAKQYCLKLQEFGLTSSISPDPSA
jgi:ATP-dependent Clp protease adapter protein ClpS